MIPGTMVPMLKDSTSPPMPDDRVDDGLPFIKLPESETKKLKQRLKISERYKEIEFKPHFDASTRLFRGIHWPEGRYRSTEEARVIVNIPFPLVNTKVATIGFRYPEFDLTPLNSQSDDKADLATAAMRYEWKISKTQREVVRALWDKEVYGFGVVMTGWEFETTTGIHRHDGRSTVEGEDPDAPIDFDAMAAMVSKTGSPDGEEEVSPDEVTTDQFYCRRICPYNFLIDPEADWVIDNHEFLGYVELVPVGVLKGDPRLKNTKDLKGTSQGLKSFLDSEMSMRDEADHPTDIKRVKVYHYYEKRRELYAMFCDEHDKPLLIQKWPWEHGRYPFRLLHAPKTQDRFYDTSPLEMVQSQQEELNVTRTMLRTHIRRNARKYSVARGMLDRTAKLQLKSAVDGAIIEHNGGPDARVIMPIDHNPLVPEIYKTDEWAIRDMRFISGLDEYETNNVGKTRRTAMEVEQIRQGGGSRSAKDAQDFEYFCAEVGEDCLDLLMQYSQKVRSIPIYDQNDNISEWSDFTADDIKGDYLVNVYIGSTQPKSNSDTQQAYAWLLQTLAPFAQQPDPATGQPMINIKALVKGLLSAFPDIRNVDQILTPDQPPQMPMQPPMQPPMGSLPGGSPTALPPQGMPLPQGIEQMMQPQPQGAPQR